MRGYEEENVIQLRLWWDRKKIPTNWKEIKLKKKEFLGSTTVRGMGADRTVPPYPTSCQNPQQTKSVRVVGTGRYAPYRLPYQVTDIRRIGKKYFFKSCEQTRKRKRKPIVTLTTVGMGIHDRTGRPYGGQGRKQNSL
jgi:hypothetical protein